MNNKSIATEIGQRCRRFRNALGISQQKLADMIGTTPQNISKYEKEGIHDIDTIRYLSSALGHDLMMDEADEEGTVGEIGKEILYILAEGRTVSTLNFGRVDVGNLVEGLQLFGLSKERVIKEIFKLEKIGLCIREQYVDIYDCEKDVIFITAKGLITLKHISGWKYESDDYANVKTYEMICEGHESYQAYIDSRPEEKIIRNIDVKNGFRVNYISYLMNAYDAKHTILEILEKYILGKSAYTDILFSMIMEITREKVDQMIQMIDETYSEEVFEEYEKVCSNIYRDEKHRGLVGVLENYVDYDLVEIDIDCDDWLKKNTDSVNDDIFRKQREMELADEKLEQMINQAETRLSELFTSKLRDHEYKNPLEWYSKEEIELFIKENIREASSEYEMNIEKKLAKIYETKPEIVAKYFEFPDEWEENGLADLVRKLYKVDKYKEKLRG